MDNVKIYYLSQDGSERDRLMRKRFDTLGLKFTQVEWADNNWMKSNGYDSGYSCMFGHIKMLKKFIEDAGSNDKLSNDKLSNDNLFCCVFEDDVYISKYLSSDMGMLLSRMELLKLDILLIGYLIDNFDVVKRSIHSITFSGYDSELWGSQGYIVPMKVAKKLVEIYDEAYLIRYLDGKEKVPFSADWTITKYGNRALVYPMYAVEEGTIKSDHPAQVSYHKRCAAFNYDPNIYI